MEVPCESRRESLPDFELSTEGRKKRRGHTPLHFTQLLIHKRKRRKGTVKEKVCLSFLSTPFWKVEKASFFGTNAEPFKMDWSGKKERLKTDSIYSLKYKVSLKSKVFTFKVMSAFLLSKSPWKWQKQCNKVTSQRESWKIGKYFEVDLFFGLL